MKFLRIYIAFLIFSSVNLLSWDRYIIDVEDAQLLSVSRAIAYMQVGLTEITGNNDGEHITRYMNCCHLSGAKAYPYCAAGQCWCFWGASKLTNIKYPFSKRSAVANYYYDFALSNGFRDSLAIPQVDDLMVWKHRTGRTGHIERIISTDNGILTVGFNTSNGKKGSQREGNGIFIRKRSLNSPLGRMRLRGIVGFREK